MLGMGMPFDPNNIVDDNNAPTNFEFIARTIHFNEDGDYLTYSNNVDDDPVRIVGIQGFAETNTNISKMVRNESVGSPSTQFNVTMPTAGIFRYTFNGSGLDPDFDEKSTAIGTEVFIADTELAAGNEGTFEIVARGVNYFDVENASGVVETGKAITASGKFIVRAVPKAGHIRLLF